MAVAKEQVTAAAVVAMEQVVMAVVRAVSWCMRWCGEVRCRGPQADVGACGFLSLSQRERTRGLFFKYAQVNVSILWRVG